METELRYGPTTLDSLHFIRRRGARSLFIIIINIKIVKEIVSMFRDRHIKRAASGQYQNMLNICIKFAYPGPPSEHSMNYCDSTQI